MTIAICYLSPEGVVLGADSTSSAVPANGRFHYLNHNQKLFELGENGTMAALTWGLGGLGQTSYRTLFALLGDDLKKTRPKDMLDVATRWAKQFWKAYSTAPILAPLFAQGKALAAKKAFDPKADPPDTAARTKEEEEQLQELKRALFVGFCIAGRCPPDRTSAAYEVTFNPLLAAPPVPKPLSGAPTWGAPNMIARLVSGCDPDLRQEILQSGKWTGSAGDLDQVISRQALAHPVLPIRDAVDFVHACIYSTIKAMKFSNLNQICGGPIEIAVITSDRNFRWVRHKEWDSAILEGESV